MSNYGTSEEQQAVAEAPATYTNTVLAGAVALAFILGAAAAAVVAPNTPTPVQALDSAAPLCNSSVETRALTKMHGAFKMQCAHRRTGMS